MSEVARRASIWGFVVVWYSTMLWIAITIAPAGLLGTLAFPVVGAIILTSRPGNGVGRALLGFSFAALLVGAGTELTLRFEWPASIESIGQALTWPFWLLLPAIALLFPTGRVETHFGRVTGWTTITVGALLAAVTLIDPARLYGSGRTNPFAIESADTLARVLTGPLATAAQAALALAALADLFARWRRSSGIERLQFRWFVFALSLIAPLIAAISLLLTVVPDSVVPVIAGTAGGFVLNLIPVAIFIAVTRYGLFEINRIISRTVSYATVTVLVAGVYAIMVTTLSTLLPNLPSLGVAIATLIAAALFLPVLRLLQRAVDRRFDRERYDAEAVVGTFGEHLRTDVDPSSSAAELLEAVEKTLQPAAVGLWTTGGTR